MRVMAAEGKLNLQSQPSDVGEVRVSLLWTRSAVVARVAALLGSLTYSGARKWLRDVWPTLQNRLCSRLASGRKTPSQSSGRRLIISSKGFHQNSTPASFHLQLRLERRLVYATQHWTSAQLHKWAATSFTAALTQTALQISQTQIQYDRLETFCLENQI